MKSLLVSVFLLLFIGFSHAQSPLRNKARTAAGVHGAPASAGVTYPPRINPFLKILGADHPGLGAYIVGLGDVNGDGYGDFAVSSTLDTTFIYFGGPNLDDQADLFVLGGGRGIVAGDINGDGYTDLVTAQYDQNSKLDPDNRGLVRVYLHNHSSGAYSREPDLKIVGNNPRSNLGRGGATHLLGGDVNGDGKLDLLVEGYNDKTPNGRGIVYLYLGSATPDTISDFQFMDTHAGEPRGNFGEKFAVTDLNRDGFDDVLIQGMGKQDTNEEIHLGNPQAQFGAPYRDVKFQDPFISILFPWHVADIDGNACPEIFPRSEQQSPPFGWGKCGQDFPTQTFLPDTVFPNPDPSVFGEGLHTTSIRHFSGTPYEEYLINWSISGISDGVSCWIYQSGPGWETTAIAYCTIRVMSDGVYGDPFPIGDVTGDNIDDFALICQAPYGIGYPVWIFKGDRQYRLAGVQTGVNGPSPTFHLYPNPVTSFDARRVYLQGTLGLPSQLEIEVYDILGRSIFHISRRFDSAGAFQVPIEIGNVKPGSYFVSIDDGENRCVRSLVILSH